MGKTTSTERMRKLRQRRKEEEDFDLEFHREKERRRVADIRKKQKEVRNINESKQEEYRSYERLRKRKQRERKRQDKGNIDRRIESNYKKGRSTRIKNSKDKENQIKRLHLKLKFVTNENRRLKRRLNSTPQSEDYEASTSCSESSFMSALSPSAKRRATKRLSLSKAPATW